VIPVLIVILIRSFFPFVGFSEPYDSRSSHNIYWKASSSPWNQPDKSSDQAQVSLLYVWILAQRPCFPFHDDGSGFEHISVGCYGKSHSGILFHE